MTQLENALFSFETGSLLRHDRNHMRDLLAHLALLLAHDVRVKRLVAGVYTYGWGVHI